MAPKKALHPPPSPEPEEEEETSEEESGESEEGEESEEESEVEEKERHKEKITQIQPTQVNKKSGGQKQTTPPPSAPQSDEEEEGSESEEDGGGEDGVESDSPPSPNVSDFTIKPISPAKPVFKDAKPTAKRSVDAQKDDEKDSRNRKKAKSNEGEEKKEKASAVSVSVSASASAGAGRVWSEEDEIAVLQGMIDYQNKKGADPSNDMAAFHEFVKGKLRADISKTQLYEKVRRFKKKFFTNMEKAESSGEDPTFSKNHDSIAFELSKKIWGSGAQSNGGGVDNGKGKKVGKIGSVGGIVKEGEKKGGAKVGSISGMVKEDVKDDVVMDDMGENEGDFQSKYLHLSQSFDLDGSSFFSDGVRSSLKENLSLIDSVKARELNDKWKKLREQEAELFLRRMTLMTEQTKLVLNAGKKRRIQPQENQGCEALPEPPFPRLFGR